MRWLPVLLLLLPSCGGAPLRTSAPSPDEPLAWNEWSPSAFERARAEGKVVLLSVQAGWCHWCHVMNDTTFRDPEVRRLLAESFVLIRADGDARPDLADRYRRYAWPATVFLHPEGGEILGLRGYRAPDRFRAILGEVTVAAREGRTLVDAAPSERESDLEEVRASLLGQLDRMYDEELGGWGRRQRYPFAAPVEHALLRAVVRDEAEWRRRALTTLERYATLIDPVWGGMYQYSEGGVWDRPHYEKIVPVQAGAIRAFAEAYRASGDRRWLARAEDVRRYVRAQLRAPDGAFFTSQDADLAEPHVPGPDYYARDDAGRRALGLPRVDRHVYASTNGMLIEALSQLSVALVAPLRDGIPTPANGGRGRATVTPLRSSIASGEPGPLEEAIAAAERVLTTHRHPSGLFVHDAEAAPTLLHLADQAHMLAALLALHQASAEPRWLEEASRLAGALEALRDPESGGFFAHTVDPDAVGVFRERRIPIADNAIVARALMALARLTDRDELHEAALAALRACARPDELRGLGRMIGEYLIALEIAAESYVLFSIVGPDEPRTQALHSAALRFVDPTRLVELARPGASRYPYPDEPAVFLCTRTACSMPVTDPRELAPAARAFLRR